MIWESWSGQWCPHLSKEGRRLQEHRSLVGQVFKPKTPRGVHRLPREWTDTDIWVPRSEGPCIRVLGRGQEARTYEQVLGIPPQPSAVLGSRGKATGPFNLLLTVAVGETGTA